MAKGEKVDGGVSKYLQLIFATVLHLPIIA